MNRSIEWRLARAFLRCYSLLVFVSLINTSFGQLFGAFFIKGIDPAVAASNRAYAGGYILCGLVTAVLLWSFSDRIADKLTKSPEFQTFKLKLKSSRFRLTLALGLRDWFFW